MEEKKAKLIFNAGLCRALLKRNCKLIDIKPDRDNPIKSVFVFEKNETFEKAFTEINDELKAKEGQ